VLQPVLGKLVQRPARLDKKLAKDLKALAEPSALYDTVVGKTMCTYDFYEGKIVLLYYLKPLNQNDLDN
jgi:uridine phosphorylase